MTFSNPLRYQRHGTAARITAGLTLAIAVAVLALVPAQAQTPAQATSASALQASAVTNNTPVPELPALTAPNSGPGYSPYGLRAVWAQGDLVARGTLLILALMSLGSWYVIFAKMLEQRRLLQQGQQARSAFSGKPSLRAAADSLPKTSPFRTLVDSALDGVQQHDKLAHQVDMAEWLSQDIVRHVGNLTLRGQTGMSALATVGSTAPFVGLFGTVWGIYNALVTIGVTGQASIDKVAGPVGEALIMTALGLAVAVPAVLGYNWLVRRNRVAMHTLKAFGSDLHTQLLIDVERHQHGGKSAAQKA